MRKSVGFSFTLAAIAMFGIGFIGAALVEATKAAFNGYMKAQFSDIGRAVSIGLPVKVKGDKLKIAPAPAQEKKEASAVPTGDSFKERLVGKPQNFYEELLTPAPVEVGNWHCSSLHPYSDSPGPC